MKQLALLALLLAFPAVGHEHGAGSWINNQRLVDPQSGEWCCNHMDCFPQPANAVQEVHGGYFVYRTGETIPYHRVIWKSPDGAWWLCHMHKDGKPVARCLIGPPPGS